jgi:hypothetical protein
LTGIFDPQNQGGGNAANSAAATVSQIGGDLALSPTPTIGFSGAAATDGDGKLVGIALLKPALVAGPNAATPPAQAVLVSADTLRDFLKANGVDAAGGSSDAKFADAPADATPADAKSSDTKASVVRVICVRK